LHRDDLGVPRVGEPGVQELESRRRLNVGELQVGDVNQAEQRTARAARRFRPLPPRKPGCAEVVADKVRLALADLDGPVSGGPSVMEHRPATEPTIRG
jgi:hypothetical protein